MPGDSSRQSERRASLELAPTRSVVDALWLALTAEPGTGVWMVNPSADVLFANDDAAAFVDPGARAADHVQTNLAEYISPEKLRELLMDLEDVARRRTPIVKRGIYRGAQHFTIIRPFPLEPGDTQTLLVMSRRVGGADADSYLRQSRYEVRYSAYCELGELSELSGRELEVLALMGMGKGVDETAEALHRSRETIKTHRKSIAEKLGTSDRVVLAEKAVRAGLRVEDAELSRYRAVRPGESASSASGGGGGASGGSGRAGGESPDTESPGNADE